MTLTNLRLSSFDAKIKRTIVAQPVSELRRPQEACASVRYGCLVSTKWLITNLEAAITSPPVIYREATT